MIFSIWYGVKSVGMVEGGACMCECSVVSASATSWTVKCQAPLSMGFCRQEYWSG